MQRHLKLSKHEHTGSHRPHEHTSYVALIMLLTIVGASLTAFTSTAFLSPGPESQTIGLGGTVPAAPPTAAATITTPSDNIVVTSTPITVSGTCPKSLIVEVYKNDIFAGSTMCDDNGQYTIRIDLLVGANKLTAHVYDALNQEGPSSNSVTVTYNAPTYIDGQLSALSFGGNQLLLNTDAVFRGTFPEQTLTVPLDIIGGRAPYAINIQWGDSTNKVLSRPTNESFRVGHVYNAAGTYPISIQATDTDGRVAFLTVAAIVNGQTVSATSASATGTSSTSNTILERLVVLWPAYAVTATMVTSFWFGSHREKRLLMKHGVLSNAQ